MWSVSAHGFGKLTFPVQALTSRISQIDCYKPSAGEFLVCATVFKNVFGYGMSRYFNDWVVRDGYVGPFMTILALNLACLLFGAVPLYFYGKRVRGWSANSSIHRVS